MSCRPRHLLVPVDVDPGADRALAVQLVNDAADMARAFGADITLLHVMTPLVAPLAAPLDIGADVYRAALDVSDAKQKTATKALAELARLAQERCAGDNGDGTGTGAPDAPVQTMVTTSALGVARTIIDVAQQLGADMIMVATHGRRGVARVLLGSVAEKTAHLAPVPVLLIPPRDAPATTATSATPASTPGEQGERHGDASGR